MRFNLQYPSYPVSNVPRLSKYRRPFLGEAAIDMESAYGQALTFGDRTVFIDTDGTVYLQQPDGSVSVEPNLSAALRQVEANAPGAVATARESGGSTFDSILANLTQIVQSVTMSQMQRDLLRVNLDRASRGLPPLNAQQYMPGVNVGISDDTKTLLYILGAGVLGVMLLRRR